MRRRAAENSRKHSLNYYGGYGQRIHLVTNSIANKSPYSQPSINPAAQPLLDSTSTHHQCTESGHPSAPRSPLAGPSKEQPHVLALKD
jgi:hypothetical protein